MSQSGRGLNGGIDYVFYFIEFLDHLSNGNSSFYVNSLGDVICNSLNILGSLVVDTLTVLTAIVAPSFRNTDNSFSVNSLGQISASRVGLTGNLGCSVVWCTNCNASGLLSGTDVIFGPSVDRSLNALWSTVQAIPSIYATISSLSNYLTTSAAASTYATLVLLSTYYTQTDTQLLFLSKADANLQYLKKTDAATTYAPLTTTNTLQAFSCKGCAEIFYNVPLGGIYQVIGTLNMSFTFNDGGVNGKHLVSAGGFGANYLGVLVIVSRPTTGLTAPAVFNVINTSAGSSATWTMETYNVGGDRRNCSFYCVCY